MRVAYKIIVETLVNLMNQETLIKDLVYFSRNFLINI